MLKVYGEVNKRLYGGRCAYIGRLIDAETQREVFSTDTCVHQADAINRMDHWCQEHQVHIVPHPEKRK